MTPARLAHICRHPIKSAGYETLTEVALQEGQPLPWDRIWAVAHAGAAFAGDPEGWASKLNFLRGWAEGSLMAVRAQLDAETGTIRLSHPERPDLIARLPQDGPAVVDWLRPLWPDSRPPLTALVSRRDGGALSDVPGAWVSVLNLASQADLGARMGQDLSIHRWRGNLWLDGLAPWSEFDLIGHEVAIGGARLRITKRITRCRATCANPETGQTDADTLAALQQDYGHTDFGVYAEVITGGTIAIGDEVRA